MTEGETVNESVKGIGAVPVPGSEELTEGEIVNEGVKGIGVVPVPGSVKFMDGETVNEGVKRVGAVPVPGSVEFKEGEVVNEGVKGVGVVPILGNVEFSSGYGDRDGDIIDVREVPLFEEGEVGAGKVVRLEVGNGPPLVRKLLELPVVDVEYVPDLAPEGMLPVPGDDVLGERYDEGMGIVTVGGEVPVPGNDELPTIEGMDVGVVAVG